MFSEEKVEVAQLEEKGFVSLSDWPWNARTNSRAKQTVSRALAEPEQAVAAVVAEAALAEPAAEAAVAADYPRKHRASTPGS